MPDVLINQKVRDVAAAYTPNVEEAREAYALAIARANVVQMSIGIFRALSPHADELDQTGSALLCGVSETIVRYQAEGMAVEASAMSAKMRARLSSVPAP
jgi:hypothetical protein